jgi:hypothetical protein
MFVLYACCDKSGESNIRLISGGPLDAFYRSAVYIPDNIVWSVWIVPGAITE